MIIEKLKEFGLSEKEALIYVALFELESAVASDIAKKANINRSTTYVILDALLKHGFANFIEKNGIKLYSPTTPERLIQHLENKAKKYNTLAVSAKELVSQLKKPGKEKHPKPKIQFIEGEKGIQTVYEDVLTTLEKVRTYGAAATIKKTPLNFLPQYYKHLAKKKITIQTILPNTPETRKFLKQNKKDAGEVFLVPPEKNGSSPEISIYGNKTVFISPIEKFALTIESQEIADALKNTFDLAWQEAKRLNKKSIFGSEKFAT